MKEFNCPSCSAPMKFSGGESIFQTCEACHAPIVVPSDIFYPKDLQIASGNFATLAKDVEVDVEQVTNELTPGDELPAENEVLDPEAKIEKFEIYQEKIGTNSAQSKKAVDKIITAKNEFDISAPALPESEEQSDEARGRNAKAVLERIRNELLSGDKIEAIKIYKSVFGTSLKEAKDTIDEMERREFEAKQRK
ncbi:MAG: hypothetical protein R2681_12205 [Pyrinomonadaceae bacterium]